MKDLAIRRQQMSRNGQAQALSELEQVRQQWTRNMISYWQERIDKLHVSDTGSLRSSITGMMHQGNTMTTIEHSFLVYGLYNNDGVGREFGDGYTDSMGRTYRGRGTAAAGQLPFLLPGGEAYRKEHGLDKARKVGPAWRGRMAGGKPRAKRDWFFRKYYSSRMVLNEMEAAAYGQAYQGMLVQAVDSLMGTLRVM